MRYRNLRLRSGAPTVKVDTSREAVLKLALRGRRAMNDYYDYKYLLFKEIYENGIGA